MLPIAATVDHKTYREIRYASAISRLSAFRLLQRCDGTEQCLGCATLFCLHADARPG
jgi:hypothetical protein